MKNLIRLMGFIIIVAVIGFSLVACDNGSSGDNNNSENTGVNNPGGNNPGGNNPGGNNPGGNNPGENNPGGNNPVLTLTSVEASPTSAPTGNLIPYLYLKFNLNAGISINDITISGVNGITKSGSLTDTSHGGGTSYVLGLKTEAKTSGTITVSVTKSGQAVNGSPKTVYVYNNSNFAYP
jgi:hypothetical protein